jgi:drug/metabolite transporter (DMT)-like permease
MSRRGWMLFLAMGVIWGVPYLLIKVAVDGLTPASLVLVRTSAAALILLPLTLARGDLRPVMRRWRPVLAFTLTELAVPWFLLSNAERQLSSSLSGLLIVAVPLIGALLGWATDGERLGVRRILGSPSESVAWPSSPGFTWVAVTSRHSSKWPLSPSGTPSAHSSWSDT